MITFLLIYDNIKGEKIKFVYCESYERVQAIVKELIRDKDHLKPGEFVMIHKANSHAPYFTEVDPNQRALWYQFSEYEPYFTREEKINNLLNEDQTS